MTENIPSWAVEQVWGSDRFYSEGDVAKGQIAFVIDSGVALLDDLNVNTEWSRSFVSSEPDPHDPGAAHGTAVASLIGSKANGSGLTGVAPGAEIVALKALSNAGWGTNHRITDALAYARDLIVENDLFDSAVVNLSLGASNPDRHPIVREMADMGIKIVVSAGNSASDADGFSPASYGDHENVYTISASTKGGSYSGFTNYDNLDADGLDDVDFAAPGSSVPTYNTDGTISLRNGTSFSAPLVAGILLMSDDVKAGKTFEMIARQRDAGMIPDPLAMFDPDSYKHGDVNICPTPDPIYIEVPGPVVEVPVYIEVPGPVVEVPVPVPGPVVEVPTPVLRGELYARNQLVGSQDGDAITGGLLKDVLEGRAGDDVIFGLGGGDRIRGGQGDDLIDPGQGKSKVRGGEGSDTFILQTGNGFTRVLDFQAGEDVLVLQDSDLAVVRQSSSWTEIEIEGDVVAKLQGTFELSDLF